MEILRIENLSFSYPNSSKKALDGVSFGVSAGEFILICGESGCGKTTLLKMLKKELSPHGEKSGRVLFCGAPLDDLDKRTSAARLGYVSQDPEAQIVTDKVWHELAFGLENLGMDTAEIRRRVAETASFFGIADWFCGDTDTLSGGQKQLLNLASVMVMQPEILLLDEPVNALDPAGVEMACRLFDGARRHGAIVVIACHDSEELEGLFDERIDLSDGRIVGRRCPHE